MQTSNMTSIPTMICHVMKSISKNRKLFFWRTACGEGTWAAGRRRPFAIRQTTISLLGATGLFLALSAIPAFSTLLVYEPFDYTDGDPVLSQTPTIPGTAWERAGTAGTTTVHHIVSPDLSYPGFLPSTGNAGDMVAADNKEFARLDLPSTYGTNTTLYYSLLLNVPDLTGLTVPNSNANANNDGIIMFNNTTGAQANRPSNWGAELVIRQGSVSGTYNLGIRASSTPQGTAEGLHTPWTGDITADSTTHLVVVRFIQGSDPSAASSSLDDTNSFWIDPIASTWGVPESSVPPSDGDSNGSINQANAGLNYAASVLIGAGISAGSNPNDVYIDEIRVGTTWADVTSIIPTLNISYSGGLAVLSWETNFTRFVLEAGTNVVNSTWTNVTPATIVGQNYQITQPIAGSQLFYRLKFQ
jgi:hypothetical protein